LIRRRFKKRYTQWIWHGENYEEFMNVTTSRVAFISETIVSDKSEDENVENFELVTVVRDDSDGENIQNLDNPECMKHNNNLDEIMNDIAADFFDISEVFENLCNNSNTPLYHDCMKFTKISVVFKLYNLTVLERKLLEMRLHFLMIFN
jgi:hypothetical protein